MGCISLLGYFYAMQHGAENGVIVNYDAEQFNIQPAIDTLVLDSMRRFNHTTSAILHTYQCYLKVWTLFFSNLVKKSKRKFLQKKLS